MVSAAHAQTEASHEEHGDVKDCPAVQEALEEGLEAGLSGQHAMGTDPEEQAAVRRGRGPVATRAR